jgi:hypothetical protein
MKLDAHIGDGRSIQLRVEHVADMFDMIVGYNDEIAKACASKDLERQEAVRYQRPVGARPRGKGSARPCARHSYDAIRQELITFNADNGWNCPRRTGHRRWSGPRAGCAGSTSTSTPPASRSSARSSNTVGN